MVLELYEEEFRDAFIHVHPADDTSEEFSGMKDFNFGGRLAEGNGVGDNQLSQP